MLYVEKIICSVTSIKCGGRPRGERSWDQSIPCTTEDADFDLYSLISRSIDLTVGLGFPV